MDSPKIQMIEVWAQLYLSGEDSLRVRDFFVSEFGIKPRFVIRNMHITVYHARRQMPGVAPMSETAGVVLAASETRFMVMGPGGENPRPEVDPGQRKVGIRVHKQSAALPSILKYRDRLLKYETERVLGRRSPSTHRTNAFGARHFQPHMAILRAGSGVDHDLKIVGIPFREALGNLTFDKFAIDIRTRGSSVGTRHT